MKKFIMSKSKVDNLEGAGSPTSTGSASDLQPHLSPESCPDDGSKIHPPLPVEPPLPVSPLLSPKKEIIDDFENEDFDKMSEEQSTVQTDELMKSIKTDPSEEPVKEEICRDYLRGTCMRVDCRYKHKLDFSKLQSLYTFCHDFQNKKCFLSKCKYVHATISEQEKFYKTGKLPPHTLSHHKGTNAPASNVGPDSAESSMKLNHTTAKPSPAPVGNVKPMPVITVIPDASKNNGKRNFEENGLSVKSNISDDGNHDDSKPLNCSVMESRLQFAKERAESMVKTLEEIDVKLPELEMKEKRIQLAMTYFTENYPGGVMNGNISQLQAFINNFTSNASS